MFTIQYNKDLSPSKDRAGLLFGWEMIQILKLRALVYCVPLHMHMSDDPFYVHRRNWAPGIGYIDADSLATISPTCRTSYSAIMSFLPAFMKLWQANLLVYRKPQNLRHITVFKKYYTLSFTFLEKKSLDYIIFRSLSSLIIAYNSY
jgi:hypothetical protein